MAVNLSPIGGVAAQFFDNSGNVLSGGKIFTYAAGTTTPQATYTSAAGTTALANPIILDAAGRVPTGEIWLTDGLQYKFIIKTSTDVQIGSYDNLVGINSNFVNYTNSQEFQTATAGQTVFTLTTMQYQPGTNSLSVFVDGVNQYGPGALYAYTETSSTVVTFTAGLHVGADVKFTTSTINASAATDAEQVGYIPPFTGSVATNVEAKLAQTVSVKDFGAVGDGVVNDTAAIQAAVTAAAGKRVYVPAGTYLITSAINLPSNTTIFGDGASSVIKQGVGGISCFVANNKTFVTVEKLKFLNTFVSATAYIGAVAFLTSTNCMASELVVEGMVWAGVYLNTTSYCTVDKCYFSGWLGSVQDSADISLYGENDYNIVTNNVCYGGGDHGVFVDDPYLGVTPTGNIISNNQIGEHKAYGIAVYVTTSMDTKTIITNNVIRDILGSQISGSSGAGIYLQSSGGAIVSGNSVSNCCRNTSNFDTLGMGAIAVQVSNYGTAGTAPIIVTNNSIEAQRGPGIFAASSDKAVIIANNTIRSSGTTAVRGEGIVVQDVACVKISGNVIYHVNTNYYAVRITAVSFSTSEHEVSNNTIYATGGGGILMNVFPTFTLNNCLVFGNSIRNLTAGVAYNFSSCDYLRFSSNYGSSTAITLRVSSCLRVRYTGNQIVSTSAGYAAIFTGTNTGSIFDESNDLRCLTQNDAGNGTIISQYGNAAPASSGIWDVSDRVIQSVSVVGQPKGWRCTVAGSPGTWVSEGNL